MLTNMRFYPASSHVTSKIHSGHFEHIKKLHCEEPRVSGLFKNGKKKSPAKRIVASIALALSLVQNYKQFTNLGTHKN